MNDLSVLAPPIAFAILLAAVGLLSLGMSRLSANRKGNRQTGPYACGEDLPTHMIQPDYGQFLPFAVFFTILHVVALMVTTAAGVTAAAFVIALVYVTGALLGLVVLYRK